MTTPAKIHPAFEKPIKGGAFDIPVGNPAVEELTEDLAKADPVLEWLDGIIMRHTPKWALILAMISQEKPFRWMRKFPLPLVRKLTDVTVKTETHMEQPKKGFRPGHIREQRTLRVYKRGRMIAERTFPAEIIKDPNYSKLV